MDKLNYIAENKLPIRDLSKVRREPRLLNVIQLIIDENSGGMKFTELLTELAKNANTNALRDILTDFKGNEIPDIVETTIRDFGGKIKILDYTWQSMNRAKMFVYTE